MARRKDQSINGRSVAGEDGGLFLLTDGVSPVFDWHEAEVFHEATTARAAWERARVPTWRHDHRDEVWPPVGAVWDGLTSRTAECSWNADPARVAECVAADLANVAEFRRARPDAAAAIAAELAEYVTALDLLAGLSVLDQDPAERIAAWRRITTRPE